MSAPKQYQVGGRTFTVLYPDLLRPLSQDEGDDLRQSIKTLGVRNPVIVDEGWGIIDGGNRIRIADELGLTTIPVTVLPGLSEETKRQIALDLNVARRQLTPEEKRAARIAKVVELRQEGKSIRQIEQETGIPRTQVERDLKTIVHSVDNPAPDRINTSDGRTYPARRPESPPVAEPELTQAGDPEEDEDDWEEEEPTPARETTEEREARRLSDLAAAAEDSPSVSSRWSLLNCDCIEGLQDVEIGSVRLVFADPPYNIGWNYGDGEQNDRIPGYLDWCGQWLRLCREVAAPDASLWLLISDEYAAELKMAAQDAGWFFRQWIIWFESFGVNCSNKFNRTHRHLFWFTNDPEEFVFHPEAVKRPSDRQEKYGDARAADGGKLWDSVWGINPPIPRVCGTFKEAVPGSPAPQLPLSLLRPIIACASNPGDLVLDPFGGNATTGAAALELDRRFVGFELREPIHRLATLRLRACEAALTKESAS